MSMQKGNLPGSKNSFHRIARYYTAVLLLTITLVEIFTVDYLYNNFHRQQMQLAQASVKGVQNNIEDFVVSKSTQLKLFARSEKELLIDLADFPADLENLQRLETLIDQRINNVFSYMIASSNGEPLLAEKLTTVGSVCLVGIRSYAQRHEYLPNSVVTHGSNNDDYHFDIMTSIKVSDVDQAIFFISFRLDTIVRLLANAQLPNQSIIITKMTDPDQVEISASGVRTSTYGPSINAESKDPILYQTDIKGTGWHITSFSHNQYLNVYFKVLVLIAVIIFGLVLGLVVLFLHQIRTEELKRFMTESELAASNENLEKTVMTRTRALHKERDKAHVTLNSIGDGVITTDAKGIVDSLNPLAEKMTGWPAPEAKGQHINEIFHVIDEHNRRPFQNLVQQAVYTRQASKVSADAILVNRIGHDLAVQTNCAPIFDRQGRVLGAVLVFHDASQQRKALKEIQFKANHDSLTGVLNRSAFEQRFQLILNRLEKEEKPNILLYMDLDNFKQVNDTAGHAAGDELLKKLVIRIQDVLRQRDVFARLGGDEFALILENCSPRVGRRVAEKIQVLVKDFVLNWESEAFSVGISIGLISFCNHSESMDNLLNQADAACYQAKHSGGNTITSILLK